jgi:alpha-mannosidase
LQVTVVDGVVSSLDRTNETGIEHFHWDSQSVLVQDYLAARPESRQHIVDLINNNQLGVGPWYTQPDEFLVSGEALIRNLLYGIMTLEDLNAAYTPIGKFYISIDHSSCIETAFCKVTFPISLVTLRKCLRSLWVLIWSLLQQCAEHHKEVFHCFFQCVCQILTLLKAAKNNLWQSPDGTQILLLRFGNYCGMHFNEGKPSVRAAVEEKLSQSRGRADDGVKTLYWMNGCDHRDLDTQVGLSVRKANLEKTGW